MRLIGGIPWFLWMGVVTFTVGGVGDLAAHGFGRMAWEHPAHLMTFAGMVATVGAIVAEPLLRRRSP